MHRTPDGRRSPPDELQFGAVSAVVTLALYGGVLAVDGVALKVR
jgi:hypothetical protein